MVGPGTGVAAFRSFIHARKSMDSEQPQMVLIFGCRSESKDYYYADEWQQIRNLKVITAFSRQQPDGSKQYVQHVIREQANAECLAELILNQNANIYVSGRAKLMPQSVEKAFAEIIGRTLGSTVEEDKEEEQEEGEAAIEDESQRQKGSEYIKAMKK